MLKKARAGLETGKGEDERSMSKAILKSSHQIWLAGLGAFAKAQQEGMKVFDTLVKQGETLESKTRQVAATTADAAQARGGRQGVVRVPCAKRQPPAGASTPSNPVCRRAGGEAMSGPSVGHKLTCWRTSVHGRQRAHIPLDFRRPLG